jgi:hypothetical protein
MPTAISSIETTDRRRAESLAYCFRQLGYRVHIAAEHGQGRRGIFFYVVYIEGGHV